MCIVSSYWIVAESNSFVFVCNELVENLEKKGCFKKCVFTFFLAPESKHYQITTLNRRLACTYICILWLNAVIWYRMFIRKLPNELTDALFLWFSIIRFKKEVVRTFFFFFFSSFFFFFFLSIETLLKFLTSWNLGSLSTYAFFRSLYYLVKCGFASIIAFRQETAFSKANIYMYAILSVCQIKLAFPSFRHNHMTSRWFS